MPEHKSVVYCITIASMRIVVYTIVRNVPLKMSSSFLARTVTKDALSPEPDS